MELIIQEIAEVIRVEFAEEIQRLLTEVRDISEFIMATQTMLDGIGVKLVAEAMETLDKAVRESADRKRTWVVKVKETSRIWPRYLAKSAIKGPITKIRKPENTATFQMN